MTGECAVCEAAVPDSTAHCTTCGFPMAMSDLAARSIVELPEPAVPGLPRGADPESSAQTQRPTRPLREPGPTSRGRQPNRPRRQSCGVTPAGSRRGWSGHRERTRPSGIHRGRRTRGRGPRALTGRPRSREHPVEEQFDARLKQLEERQAAMITSGVFRSTSARKSTGSGPICGPADVGSCLATHRPR